MFEVLADVDAKFAKLMDKECDGVSGEVRKWFKKLVVSLLPQLQESSPTHDYTERGEGT